jgi:flavodoxin
MDHFLLDFNAKNNEEETTMKTIIVYTSIAHGNTEKVAKAIAEVLGADLTKTQETNPTAISSYDLVGFGSGIYNGKHDKAIFELVAQMPASSGKKVFVFSTSGFGTTKLNDKLTNELTRLGFKLVGNFACKGFDTAGINKLYGGAAKGRPNEDDLKEARSFAKNLTV